MKWRQLTYKGKNSCFKQADALTKHNRPAIVKPDCNPGQQHTHTEEVIISPTEGEESGRRPLHDLQQMFSSVYEYRQAPTMQKLQWRMTKTTTGERGDTGIPHKKWFII